MTHTTDESRRDASIQVGAYTITPVCRVKITGVSVGEGVLVTGTKTPMELKVRMGAFEWTLPVPVEAADGL